MRVTDGAHERVLEQLELGLPPDELRRERVHRPGGLTDADHAARDDRLAPAAELQRCKGLEVEDVSHQPCCSRADDDLVRSRLLLETGGEIDRLAGGERRLCLVGDDLAGFDPDADVEPKVADALERRERGPDRPLGVVLVLERHAESGHHGVARELLHRPAVGRHAMRNLVKEAPNAAAHDLRIGSGK